MTPASASFHAGFPSFIVDRKVGVSFLMQMSARLRERVLIPLILALLPAAFAAEKQRTQITDVAVSAVVTPQTHQMKAQARVKFTALDDITIAVFELHNGLRPTAVLD